LVEKVFFIFFEKKRGIKHQPPGRSPLCEAIKPYVLSVKTLKTAFSRLAYQKPTFRGKAIFLHKFRSRPYFVNTGGKRAERKFGKNFSQKISSVKKLCKN
jgi:hypothetical protein